MISDDNNQEAICCEGDGEYRQYCDICDKLCTERYYKNHLKSGTEITNFRIKQQLHNTNTVCFK